MTDLSQLMEIWLEESYNCEVEWKEDEWHEREWKKAEICHEEWRQNEEEWRKMEEQKARRSEDLLRTYFSRTRAQN